MNNYNLKFFETVSVVFSILLINTLLSSPSILISNTSSSTLINIIYITILVIIFYLIICRMFSTFPGSNIIDISEFLGGKLLKYIYGFTFIVYLIFSLALIIKFISSNISLIYFSHLDVNFVALSLILAICILNLLGFKSISRLNIFVLSAMSLSIIFLFFSSLSDYTFERIFPLLGNGFKSTFIDGIENISTFSGIFALLFLASFTENFSFKKSGIISILLYSFFLLVTVAALLFSLPQSAHLNTSLSLYFLARQVTLGEYFQSIDALFLLIWIPFLLTSLSFPMNFCLNIFKQITNIKYEKELTYAFSSIVFIICIFMKNMALVNFLNESVFKYISIIFIFILSFIILLLAVIKKWILILFTKQKN